MIYSFFFTKGFYPTRFFLGKVIARHLYIVLSPKEECDEIIDRYGHMPEEIENLLEITRIKNLCREVGVTKVSQKGTSVIFYLEPSKFASENIEKLIKIYKERIQFSPGKTGYITLKKNENNIIKEIKDFLENCK